MQRDSLEHVSEDRGTSSVNEMLRQLRSGKSAPPELDSVIYKRLRSIAGAFMQRERGNHTLQPTALVHEAYMRLVDQRNADPQDQTMFIAIATKVMKRILVDHARKRGRLKRGGDRQRVDADSLSVIDPQQPERSIDILALDEVLQELRSLNKRQAEIVELRFFGGLSNEDVARHIGVSLRTVEAEWSMARAWLRSRIAQSER